MHQPAERADARANRIRLIAAAHAVFRERGIDAEMKEIAERAGVGIGTIYRNFPTKDHLIAAIFGEAIEMIDAALTAVMALDDPVEALRAVMRHGFAITDRYGDMMAAMLQRNMPAECEAQFEQLDGVRRIAAIVRRGVESGALRPTIDPDVAATRLIGSFEPWHYQLLRRTLTLDEIIAAHIDLFLNAVAARHDENPAGGQPLCDDRYR
jgi:AcrR family transcriptional regulator